MNMDADTNRVMQVAQYALERASYVHLELVELRWSLPRDMVRKSEDFEILRPTQEDIVNRRAETGEGHAETVRALRRASLIEAVDKAETIGDLKEIIKLHLTIDV